MDDLTSADVDGNMVNTAGAVKQQITRQQTAKIHLCSVSGLICRYTGEINAEIGKY